MDTLPARRRMMSAVLMSLIMLLFCMPFQSADEEDYDFAVTTGIYPGKMTYGSSRYANNVDGGCRVPTLPPVMTLAAYFAILIRYVNRSFSPTHLLSFIPLLLKRLLLEALKYRSNYMDTASVRP
ncbi:hypothetical protein PQ456_20755 [Paenibacillus kyungheensis]|uniref:Uncharacterized protein n=1 Tax=Paenibacillus kyungheensis TaxID=1452732 RepID=A0AAX3M070_9BACL|nr:hypothetical protein [Paenibacillus kyungheensis]WCT55549.1 hypothetical protein PQ456_20755 [Paenibacillus kyungheensis]